MEIQDEGSQLIAALVNARPGMRVVDWCAGAGGKTLALAAIMHNRGQIAACDVSAERLEAAVRRLRRAGVHNVERHLLAAGDKWAKRRAGSFDRVLVDAPCTGTGTWRRNPVARRRLAASDLAELLPKQTEILDAAQTLVRKGGRLVYATCSLLEEENEAQVSVLPCSPSRLRGAGGARSWRVPEKGCWIAARLPGPGRLASLPPATARTGFSLPCWSASRVITIRGLVRPMPIAIGAVHVAAWRSAYPGILPDSFLWPGCRSPARRRTTMPLSAAAALCWSPAPPAPTCRVAACRG